MGRSDDKYKSPFDKKAGRIGLVITILFHAGVLCIAVGTGLKYNYPPPPEMGILFEFEEEELKPIEVKTGHEPRAEVASPEKEVRLVQKSEAAVVAKAENKSAETTVDKDGDVEQPEPPRPKPINKRALFSSAKNKQDTLSAQVAENKSNKLKAGHAQGNTQTGSVIGAPSAKLQGRSIMGNLPQPSYSVENEGRVVVKILVDQYGTVTNAIPGIKGTTVQDATLWKAAKEAALKAKFNISSSAPTVQEGTITYVFKLH